MKKHGWRKDGFKKWKNWLQLIQKYENTNVYKSAIMILKSKGYIKDQMI